MAGNYEPRLLWAEALDGCRTAIVIEMGGQFLGGVAQLYDMSFQATPPFGWGAHADLNLRFKFEWFQVVESAEQFRGSARWKEEQAQLLRLQAELPPFDPPEDLKRQLAASPSFQKARRYLAESKVKLIEHAPKKDKIE